jgi:hypothetical protein
VAFLLRLDRTICAISANSDYLEAVYQVFRQQMGRRFDQILASALDRSGSNSGESLIVANHLSQMKLFGIRQGVEIFPLQDTNDIRRSFVNKLWTDNKIDLYLDRFWDLLLCKGRLCFYLRPNANGGYRIFHYHKDQFQANYDADGELVEVVIKYSYKAGGTPHAIAMAPNRLRWVKLRITKEQIVRYDADFEPTIGEEYQVDFAPSSVASNSLGWIPCVIVNNYTIEAGQDGVDDFTWLSAQIESHDRMSQSIRENIEFFGNPTLISSRTLNELVDGGVVNKAQRPTAASQGGFASNRMRSTARDDPFERYNASDGLRVRRVIAGVEPNDRIGYIMPDPVSPDQTRFAAEYRENIHTALGGVDPLGLSTGATAYEIKSVFGRTAATAKKRADNLYTYGICKVFEMAIAAEEIKLKRSIAQALEIPFEIVTDEGVMQLLQTGKSPKGKKLPKDFQPIGMPPLGDRTITWRWTGPVFEDSPQDTLQKSIVVRNMEEVGVETTEALRHMLPDKTEKEIRSMLTGFPFREMTESGSALGQHLSILGQMFNTPDPNNPAQPLGVSLNNLDVIAQTIAHIQKRLNYGNPVDPATDGGGYAFTPVPSSSTDGPANNAAGDANNGAANAAVPSGAVPRELLPTAGNGGTAAPYGGDLRYAAGRSVQPAYDLLSGAAISASPYAAAGIPDPSTFYGAGAGASYAKPNDRQTYGAPEYAVGLPVPGSTVAIGPGISAGQLDYAAAAPIPGLPADLAVSNPTILRQLFPTFFAVADATSGASKRKRSGK